MVPFSLIYSKNNFKVDFINDIIDWFKDLFSSEEEPKKPQSFTPPYPKMPYGKTDQPDLYAIPEDLAKFIVRWFVSSGMSLEGAAATAGNLWRESYFNPTQLQISTSGSPKGPGRGLAQWTDSTLTKKPTDDGRQRWDHYSDEFFPALKRSHVFWKDSKVDDLEPQLAYVVHEMREKFPGVWRNMTSPGSVSQKAIDVLKKYEISKDRDKKEEQNFRSNLAERIYKIASTDKMLKDAIAKRKAGK